MTPPRPGHHPGHHTTTARTLPRSHPAPQGAAACPQLPSLQLQPRPSGRCHPPPPAHLPLVDELLQRGALGQQLRQPRLQHHVGQDGQQIVRPTATTATVSHAATSTPQPPSHALPGGGGCPPAKPRTHMVAAAGGRVPQYSSAHSQMLRRARTTAQSGCAASPCHPASPDLRPASPDPPTPALAQHGPAPMQSSFLRGQVSSGMRRRWATAEPYAGQPGVAGKSREERPMSAGPAWRCRSMLRARAASRGR